MKIKFIKYLLFLLPFDAYGAELFLENGQSTNTTTGAKNMVIYNYSAALVRYKKIQTITGGWNNGRNGGANFYGLGIQGKTQKKYFIDYSLNIIKLYNNNTAHLDGDIQMLLTLGIGASFDNLIIYYKKIHISNGGTKGDNYGIDFKVMGLGLVF